MDTFSCIRKRRSCRKYSQKAVEFEKIGTILESATYAPSAGNLQEWKLIVVTDKEMITRIANFAFQQFWIAKAPVIIVACSLSDKQEKFYGHRGKEVYDVQSVAAAIENMLLTATELGLGSCWVTGFEEDRIKDMLAIPVNVPVHALITLGYPDEKPQEKHRIPLDGCTYFGKYGVPVKNFNALVNDYSIETERKVKEMQPAVQGLLDKVKGLREKVRKK